MNTRLSMLPLLLLLLADSGQAQVPSYLAREDPSFAWELTDTTAVGDCQVHLVRLTSQTWRGIPWQHWLSVIVPPEVRLPRHAVLAITGGNQRDEPPAVPRGELLLLSSYARRLGSVVAILEQVPCQPLFDGLREDALIAHTFHRYLETGDETWPLLLPMTRSAMRALDAVQALARSELQLELERFLVTGASKRGWTTYLVGALDPRVCAIAPMVFDTLNLREQMRLQLESFGSYSVQIEDYTRLRLPERVLAPRGRKLVQLVDPHALRHRLGMPKLLLLGTNDPYWPVDAVRLYLGDLPGETLLHYEPNAGHGLGPGALEALAAFYLQVARETPRPGYRWKVREDGLQAVLELEVEDPPGEVRLWQATSETRDFRRQPWTATVVTATEGDSRWAVPVEIPAEAFRACFLELAYPSPAGGSYTLSTGITVLGGALYF